ncbi:MAG TPA: hypothetical protein VN577_07070 [Terriglobales bacterium]|nr:hypothetical protein [Terriglobales bacterium]
MKKFLLALFLGTTIIALAKEETIEQLKAKAEAAEPKKRPDLYSELSRRQLEAADQVYGSDVDRARKMVEESLRSSEIAAQSAIDTGKDLKKVEIRLRKISDRMAELSRSWAFDDRQPLKTGEERIDALRTKLLERMFRK